MLDEKIVLNGKLDFLGENPDGNLHVLDFKTGLKDEEDAIQLHAYAILAESNLQRKVSKISYWYLDRSNRPTEVVLDPLEEKQAWLKDQALQIQTAVKDNHWVCIKGDQLCHECKSYQAIVDGAGEFQFSDEEFKKDIYYLPLTKRA